MPIALDVGTSSLKLLQLARGSQGLRVAAAARQELPADLPDEGAERWAVLVEMVRAMLGSGPFRGRHVVLALPDSAVQFKNVRMPKMPPDELPAALAFEAAERLPLEAEPMTLSHVVAGDVQQGEETRQEIILIAASDAHLSGYMSVLEACKLRPAALETTPTAVARCFAHLAEGSDASAVQMIVDVGHAASKVLIMRGRQIAFYRRIELGGRAFTKALAESLKIAESDAGELRRQHGVEGRQNDSAAQPLFGATRRENLGRAVAEGTRGVMQELAREVGLCLRYYCVTFRGARPGRISLCGGEAGDGQLASVMSEHIELPVVSASPLDGVAFAGPLADAAGPVAQWSLAMGLALRQAPAIPARRGAA